MNPNDELIIKIKYALDQGDMVKAQQLITDLGRKAQETSPRFTELGNKAKGALAGVQGAVKLLDGDLNGLTQLTSGLSTSFGKFGGVLGGWGAAAGAAAIVGKELGEALGAMSVQVTTVSDEVGEFAKKNREAAEDADKFRQHTEELRKKLEELKEVNLTGVTSQMKELARQMDDLAKAAGAARGAINQLSTAQGDVDVAELRLKKAKGLLTDDQFAAEERRIKYSSSRGRKVDELAEVNRMLTQMDGQNLQSSEPYKELFQRRKILEKEVRAIELNFQADTAEAVAKASTRYASVPAPTPSSRALESVNAGIQEAKATGAPESKLKALLRRRASLAADVAVEGLPEGEGREQVRDAVVRQEGRRATEEWEALARESERNYQYSQYAEGGGRVWKFIDDPREVKPWTARKRVRVRNGDGSSREEWRPVAFMPFGGMRFDRSGGVGRSGPASNARFGRPSFDRPVGYPSGGGGGGGLDPEGAELALQEILALGIQTTAGGQTVGLTGELRERAVSMISNAVRDSFSKGGQAVLNELSGLNVVLDERFTKLAEEIDLLARQVRNGR